MKTGTYRRDADDVRDRAFATLRERLTTVNVVDEFFLTQTTPVSNQGSIGSCVANATADALELLSPNPVQLSRLALYWLARSQHGEECVDEGTYPRAAFKVMNKIGVPRESIWPYDTRKVFERPPIEALQDGYDHRIGGYFRIVTNGHARAVDVRDALRAGHPVVFGVDVGDPFCDYDGADENLVWNYPARSVGGHAMVIVGFRKRATGEHDYLLRNSWGEGWGSRKIPGHAWASEQYLFEFNDLWVPTQAWEE